MNYSYSVAERAISTMNYFFLRFIVGKEDSSILMEELEFFLLAIERNGITDERIREIMSSEVFEGEYFEGYSEEEARELLDASLRLISFESLPGVIDFYISLAKDRNIFDEQDSQIPENVEGI